MSSSIKLKKTLEERLSGTDREFAYDREDETLRITDKKTGKGVSLSLGGLSARWSKEKDALLDKLVYYVEEGLKAAHQQADNNPLSTIFPVIRSASFPLETPEGELLFYQEHTAETRIYYALDLGKTYKLLTKDKMTELKVDESQVLDAARFNVKRLATEYKEDQVAGNTFYFLNHNDGYDASRILNANFLEDMKKKIIGEMAVAVPHQDVLIIGDIRNKQGYDILAQMAMQFFMNGRVPVTALPFLYENKELEPIFILAKNKPVEDETTD
ncbi:hypothetical protein AWM68_10740 [Fictibacillus phosphorivorans]|uniref:DUF1444 domain-containing protein n=1 Tax=Fictibacillus phosphorivorans TaxID=1221500 RepID=A0A163Q636_9BACL|nr:DUF1444 family protein [Fictibacillus phosphorivorans]KZE64609.1 hypothetical protein AWM68_10740 [Fictibacillus phosphorivorans]